MIQVRTPVCPKGHSLVKDGPRWLCTVCSGQPVGIVSVGPDWLDEPKFAWMKLKHPKLNPVQAAVLPMADAPSNLVIAAATSSGKTVMAELVMAPVLQPEEARPKAGVFRPKAVYLAPLKALAQEKLDDWTDPSHPFSKLDIAIATGDYLFGKQREKVLQCCAESDLLCMTSEMLDSLTRRMASESSAWLKDVRVLVVDETHLLTMEERGDRLESALMRFTKLNPKARLVFLSATLPNADKLAAWAHSLNGLPTTLIQSDWRPVELNVQYEPYPAERGWACYQSNRMSMLTKVLEQIEASRKEGHRSLVFVHSKADGHLLLKKVREGGLNAEFHNADLNKTARLAIEKEFRDKDSRLDLLIATSTLAYGLNLPARVVVVAGTKRGITPVHPYDIRQEVGRAGRYGIDPKGDAYVFLPSTDFAPELVRLKDLPPVVSQMGHEASLHFHLIAEIAEGYHNTAEELMAWYQRSFAAQQRPLPVDELNAILERFLENGLITSEVGPECSLYKATGLGKIASWLYYAPMDVAGWARNFAHLHRTRWQTTIRDKDLCVAWALANVPGHYSPYIPKPVASDVGDFQNDVSRTLQKQMGNHAVMGQAFRLAMRYPDSDVPPGWGPEVRAVRLDAERMMQAINLIDSYWGRWGLSEYWRVLGLRLKHGVAAEAVDFVEHLSGVGPERALRLLKAGYTSLEELVRAGAPALKTVLGNKLGATAWSEAARITLRRKERSHVSGELEG